MNKYKYGDVEHLKVKNKNKNKLKVFILFSISLIFVMSILAGCAPMEPTSFHRLKVQVRKLNKKTAELSQNQKYAEKKLSQMQLNTANNGVAISSLSAKIRNIYGKYEVEHHKLNVLNKKFREYRLMVNKQLIKLLKLVKTGKAASSVSSVKKQSIKSALVKKESSMESGFNEAMSQFKKKKYNSALTSLRNFLTKYPQSKYSADAMYYKAYANFKLKKYPVSILEFHKFSRLYPKSPDVPMSIYLQGMGFMKVSDPSDASILFRQVIAKYPGTKAAELSQKAINGLSK
ncbi:MAG: outer membrane protein assembly factor BamD [Candidatus Acidulodesulfobacterium acidiphilum]|uniref:Outer membrane protein assembly factor BamD n=1 Tax=Candidatus Acidulodesulfobacterium acidiphilum TaxID=2597224 RepID=A0A520XAU4_9DELT|nr:MAG: outer membrane protein assembly factor BamD [Candidatus Acidulodesulfobacterium acidiphilum]